MNLLIPSSIHLSPILVRFSAIEYHNSNAYEITKPPSEARLAIRNLRGETESAIHYLYIAALKDPTVGIHKCGNLQKEQEEKTATFWSANVTENYLFMALGRPKSVAEDTMTLIPGSRSLRLLSNFRKSCRTPPSYYLARVLANQPQSATLFSIFTIGFSNSRRL